MGYSKDGWTATRWSFESNRRPIAPTQTRPSFSKVLSGSRVLCAAWTMLALSRMLPEAEPLPLADVPCKVHVGRFACQCLRRFLIALSRLDSAVANASAPDARRLETTSEKFGAGE